MLLIYMMLRMWMSKGGNGTARAGNSYIEYLVFAAAVAAATIVFVDRIRAGDVRLQVEQTYESLQQKMGVGY